MLGDPVTLTLPVEGYENVARLVSGGLASRLDFGFEAVDDLQLAIEFVLRSLPSRSGTVDVSLVNREGSLTVVIGPVGNLSLDQRLRPLDGAGVDLGRSLTRLVDSVEIAPGPDGPMAVLAKRLPATLR
jgi:hypothetical protein